MIAFTFPEWLRLFMIVLRVPYNTAEQEREIAPLADKLALTATEKAALGWVETINMATGATSYQMDTAKIQAWADAGGVIAREFTPAERQRLLFFTQNPPQNMPWMHEAAWLKRNLEARLGGEDETR